MSHRFRVTPTLLALLLFVTAVTDGVAQTPPTPVPTGRLSISGTTGLAASMMTSGAALGGNVAFEASDRLTVEGRALWLQRGGGATALDLNAALLVTLFQSRAAAPFVVLGGGLYRARFDLSDRDMFGRMGSAVGPGMTVAAVRSFGSGMMGGDMSGGTTWMDVTHGRSVDVRGMPMFYATRLGSLVVPQDGRWPTRTFVDPAMTVGLGVRVDLSPRFYLRPDLRALVAFRDGNALTLTTATMGLGIRF